MELKLLILLILSPGMLAQRYPKNSDQSEEPFMPIFPVYPYNPKLMKRGADRELLGQLTPELYATKVDARDSYSTPLSGNYARDPYIPNYNPYPKPQTSSYSTYYSAAPYAYSTAPYNIHNSYSSPYTSNNLPASPYGSSPYTSTGYTGVLPYSSASPFATASYPNYYYQPPYYYPPYYNQPFPPPPPPPEYSKDTGNSDGKEEKEKQTSNKSKKHEDNNDNNQNSAFNQFVDGGNYISLSAHLKDLDGQSSTYKLASPYNQLEQLAKRIKSLAIPLQKGNYKIINVASQPDYSLPATVGKAQELEQLLAQTVAKLLAQNTAQITTQLHPSYDGNRNILIAKTNDEAYPQQTTYKDPPQRYISMPSNVLAKTGLAYVIDPNTVNKINLAQIANAPGPLLQPPPNIQKNTRYIQKPRTVGLEESAGIYISPHKSGKSGPLPIQSAEYDPGYENALPVKTTQPYDNYTLDHQNAKQEDNFENSHPAQANGQSYKGQNYVTVQTPQTYNYRYADYQPSSESANQQQPPQQQSQQYKTSLDDVNFGAKTNGEE